MAAEYKIKIGFFESPSEFYFTPVDRDAAAQQKLTKLELELSQYCAATSTEARKIRLQKGDVSKNNDSRQCRAKIWCRISSRKSQSQCRTLIVLGFSLMSSTLYQTLFRLSLYSI